MTSRIWLLVLLYGVCHVFADSREEWKSDDSREDGFKPDHRPPRSDDRPPRPDDRPPRPDDRPPRPDDNDNRPDPDRRRPLMAREGFIGESHICVAQFNVQVNETIYPDCPVTTTCESKCYWTGGGFDRRSWRRIPMKYVCNRDSCCDIVVHDIRIEMMNITVCCDGYTDGRFGRCSKPICKNKCMDDTTTCVAPDICGPACYPACRNGGTCQDGTPNTCSCTTGWTGPSCDMIVSCTDTGADACQNGGTCTNTRCYCDQGYYGILCDIPRCTSRCLNDGICTAPDTCQCVNGFSGANCELPPTGGVAP